MTKLPGITILIVTLNNERSIETCLKAILAQDYPKKLIQYLAIDGGSTDNTTTITKKYGFTVVKSPIPRNAEAQRAVGLKIASHNLIVSLDADNYLPNPTWLRQMVQPFIDDPTIVHAHTMHYTYRKQDALFNRYCALFGMADPVVFYVGRPDRVPQYKDTWTLGNIIRETKDYVVAEFSESTLPTVGCNGVVYRRDLLLKHAKSTPHEFLHIDVFADLVQKGFTRFAIVKTDVIHDTAMSIRFLMKKRIAFLSSYYLTSSIKRRYLIYNPKKTEDKIRLFLYILYTVTLVKPTVDALRGFVVIPDVAWFVHPLVCLIYLYAYGSASLRKKA